MNTPHATLARTLFAAMLCCMGVWASAQNYQTEFGKNRVQHHKFTWFEYHTNNFIVYWSGESRAIAHTATQMAEWDYVEVQNMLEHRIRRKIQLVIYTDLTDLKQSNIGNEEAFNNIGGQTKIVENKVFIYYDGNHGHLRQQIREGIAKVYINQMLFGSSFQEVVQNAVLLNLPPWFSEGLAAFVGEKWSTELDNQLRDVFASGKYATFEDFAAAEPRLAGHSLWYYIDMNYGQSTVSNLIYLTRINRSVRSGFLYVLSTPYGRALADWKDYFEKRYDENGKPNITPSDSLRVEVKNRRNIPIDNARISPNGQYLAYSMNEDGKQRVFIQNLADGKRRLLFKTGYRNHIQATDYNYPLVAWRPDGQQLGIIYEKRDVIKLLQVSVDGKAREEQDFAPIYQRVHSMSYLNGNELVVSGTIKGRTDIYVYRIRQRSSNAITRDFYADTDAVAVNLNGTQGIIFASDRGDYLSLEAAKRDSIIPLGKLDLYYHELGTDAELVRLTDTPLSDESSPMPVDSTHYAYLSDESGIRGLYTGKMETYHSHDELVVLAKGVEGELIFHPDSIPGIPKEEIDSQFVRAVMKRRGKNAGASNFQRGIVAAGSPLASGKWVARIRYDGADRLYVADFDTETSVFQPATPYRQELLRREKIKAEQATEKAAEKEGKGKPDAQPADWQFESDFGAPENSSEPDGGIGDAPDKEKDVDFFFVTDYPETDSPKDTLPGGAPRSEPADTPIDIDNYQFEDDFNTEVEDAAVILEDEDGRVTFQNPKIVFAKERIQHPDKKVHPFYAPNILPHRRRFRSNSVTVQLDNGQLFRGYMPFNGTPFNHIPPGIMLKSNVQDIFDDYGLEAGLRVPTTFNGMEYYVTFKDEKKRLDKYYTYYRRSIRTSVNTIGDIPPIFPELALPPNSVNILPSTPLAYPTRLRTISNLAQARVKYPLDVYGSIRARAELRLERSLLTSNFEGSLKTPSVNTQRIGVGVDYVFDNTLDLSLNIKHGTRLKLYAEAYQSMEVDLFDGFDFNFNKGVMTVFGADIRHYQRMGKYTVVATRFAGATSFGNEKILFYIGGADSELFPSTNGTIPIPDPLEDGFAYQVQATPIRGFRTNVRNGNSYFTGNVELRLSLFQAFRKRPHRSNFMRNFQVVGFFDVGTAWRGGSPFKNDNPINQATFVNPPVVSVNVNYFRDPIVAGFGGGVRTKLFGYFVRLDYGVGIETRELQQGVWHFSLGTDF